jgi:DNA invertase Pin-like site-specific DNA recombinase
MPDLLGYARVSTRLQDMEGQQIRLKEQGTIRIFEDVISGSRFERPGLGALIDYARPGDIVCVVRLDRLGRSLKELLETVEKLKKAEIHFMSLEEKIDTSSAAGELVFHVFASIAHFERRLIAERTRDGLDSARAHGKRLGRPILDQQRLQAAFTLIDTGTAPAQAASQLNIGRSTLYRELKIRL